MRILPRLLFPVVLGIGACGAEPVGPPVALSALTTGPFDGTVGVALDEPLRVRVTDANGRGVPGVPVRFTVGDGGGFIGPANATTTSHTDSTDQDGSTEVVWTLGPIAGSQAASATVEGLTPLEFGAEAAPGNPMASFVDSSSALIAPVSSATDEPLAVIVLDRYGNAVPGTTVSWTSLSPGAGVAAPSSVTDTAGVAKVGATLGAAPGLYLFRTTIAGGLVDTVGVFAVTIIADPEGDAAPTANPAYDSHDATRFGALVISDALLLYAKFSGVIGPIPTSGTLTREALIADYDLDLDGDTLTGFLSLRECLGGPPLGIGVDAFVDLSQLSAFLTGQTGVPPGAVAVLRVDSLFESDRCTSSFSGGLYAAVPFYQPTSVTLAVPLAFLGSDGSFAATTLFGHPGTASVTDVVPDSVAWTFAPTVVAGAAGYAAGSAVWGYLPLPRPTGRGVPVEGAGRGWRARR